MDTPLYANGQQLSPKNENTDNKIRLINELIDSIAQKVANELLQKSDIADWAKASTKPSYNAEEVGADAAGSAQDVLIEAKQYSDSTYTQATGYTDSKIAELMKCDETTLATLNEISAAMEENETVVEALAEAIGKRAAEADFQAHASNETVHIVASEREKWDSHEQKIADEAITREEGDNAIWDDLARGWKKITTVATEYNGALTNLAVSTSVLTDGEIVKVPVTLTAVNSFTEEIQVILAEGYYRVSNSREFTATDGSTYYTGTFSAVSSLTTGMALDQIGTRYTDGTAASRVIPAGEWVAHTPSITVPPGIYVVTASARFSGSAGAFTIRLSNEANIRDSVAASTSEWLDASIATIQNITKETDIFIEVYATKEVNSNYANVRAVRIA